MEERLTPTQLSQIVAEVQQLSDRQQDELEAEQVREILRELNLAPEFLEDAMIQIRRREALAAQKQRNRWLLGGVAALITCVLVAGALTLRQRQQTLGRITAQQDRITLQQDDGGNLGTVVRQDNAELFYRVTLSDAPVGQQLSLSCHWSDPSGQIVRQNSYQTKKITTPVWNTFCRHTVGEDAATGPWTVEAFLGDRQLSEATFNVK